MACGGRFISRNLLTEKETVGLPIRFKESYALQGMAGLERTATSTIVGRHSLPASASPTKSHRKLWYAWGTAEALIWVYSVQTLAMPLPKTCLFWLISKYFPIPTREITVWIPA